MPHKDQDIDKELEPEKLKFGMTKEQIKAWEKTWRKQDKKLAKNWRPQGH